MKPIKIKHKPKPESPKPELKIYDNNDSDNDKRYLSEWLSYDKPVKMADDSSIGSKREAEYINKMFEILDKNYSMNEVFEYRNYITDNMLNYVNDFVDKKRHANHTIEYSDYVMLVVYPQLVKNVKLKKEWDNIDKIKLMLLANDFANEPAYKDVIMPNNRFRVIRTFFLHPNKTQLIPFLKRKLPEFYKVYDEWMNDKFDVNVIKNN